MFGSRGLLLSSSANGSNRRDGSAVAPSPSSETDVRLPSERIDGPEGDAEVTPHQLSVLLLSDDNYIYKPDIDKHFVNKLPAYYSLLLKFTHKRNQTHEFIARICEYIGINQLQGSDPKQLSDLMKASWFKLYHAIGHAYMNRGSEQFIDEANAAIRYGNPLGYYFLAMYYIELAKKHNQIETHALVVENLFLFIVAIPELEKSRADFQEKLRKGLTTVDIQDFRITPIVEAAEDILLFYFTNGFDFKKISIKDRPIEYIKAMAKLPKSIKALEYLLREAEALLANKPLEAATLLSEIYSWTVVPKKSWNKSKLSWQLDLTDRNISFWNMHLKSIHEKTLTIMRGLYNHPTKEVVYTVALVQFYVGNVGVHLDVSMVFPLIFDDIASFAQFVKENESKYRQLDLKKFNEIIEIIIRFDNSHSLGVNKPGLNQELRVWLRETFIKNTKSTNDVGKLNLYSRDEFREVSISQGLEFCDKPRDYQQTKFEKMAERFWEAYFRYIDAHSNTKISCKERIRLSSDKSHQASSDSLHGVVNQVASLRLQS